MTEVDLTLDRVSPWRLIWVNSPGRETDQPAIGRSDPPNPGLSFLESPVSPPGFFFRVEFAPGLVTISPDLSYLGVYASFWVAYVRL
jgi:hypothetical protein